MSRKPRKRRPPQVKTASQQAGSGEAASSGCLLSEVPELTRGKGNKLLNVPAASFRTREEYVVAMAVFTENDQIVIRAGQRHLTLRFKDLQNYVGERARRGRKLPRGFQKVDGLEVAP